MSVAGKIIKLLRLKKFHGSRSYWESRYASGGNSGRGSYGNLADYKASVLNEFVREHGISSVIEFGCGDGNQLKLASYPTYIGLDVSETTIRNCIQTFKDDKSKSFYLYDPMAFCDHQHLFRAELTLSLDVTYHLIEYAVYDAYLKHLFNAANKFVIIYAWDVNGEDKGHVMHRKFSTWIKENMSGWELLTVNPSDNKPAEACDFFIYKKTDR